MEPDLPAAVRMGDAGAERNDQAREAGMRRTTKVIPLLAATFVAAACGTSKGTGDNSSAAQQVPNQAQPTAPAANGGGDVTSATQAGSSTTVDTSTASGNKSGGDSAKTAGRP
jgi:predicted small secreted protein